MISSCSHHYFVVKLEGKVFLATEDWARRAGCAGETGGVFRQDNQDLQEKQEEFLDKMIRLRATRLRRDGAKLTEAL